MGVFIHFLQVYWHYVNDIWLSLLAGFLISGFVNEFIPEKHVYRYLGEKGIRPIFLASLIGTALPVCCFGALPISMTLRKKGACLGPVLAFLVTTPATSISALAVAWKLLGPVFTVYIFWGVIIMGFVIGLIGNQMTVKAGFTNEGLENNCCLPPHDLAITGHHKEILQRFWDACYFGLITLPKEIGGELLLGIALASVLLIWDPLQSWVRHYLGGWRGYVFVLVLGLGTYVCCTASVPLADAFIKSGLTKGHAMTYLLVGPITSYGSMLVLKKEFGGKVLVVYLLVISIFSVALGWLFEALPKI